LRLRNLVLPIIGACAFVACSTATAEAPSHESRDSGLHAPMIAPGAETGAAVQRRLWDEAVWNGEIGRQWTVAQAELDARYAAQVAAARAQPRPAPTAPRGTPRPSGSGSSSDFLACTRGHESANYPDPYAVNTGNGYYGAYQFLPSTWNSTAQAAGRSDLVGVLPSNASPADQDAMATQLHSTAGNQPWGGRC